MFVKKSPRENLKRNSKSSRGNGELVENTTREKAGNALGSHGFREKIRSGAAGLFVVTVVSISGKKKGISDCNRPSTPTSLWLTTLTTNRTLSIRASVSRNQIL
jgi:hypothetical protein